MGGRSLAVRYAFSQPVTSNYIPYIGLKIDRWNWKPELITLAFIFAGARYAAGLVAFRALS